VHFFASCEGRAKYAIRGTTDVSAALSERPGTTGGDRKLDPAFDAAHSSQRSYALPRWNQYVTQDIGN
jgi:hypothetical protein